MATYKMLQPGLANVIRDDGQSMILPLDEQTAQAQGLTPETGPNPYSMANSGQAVAGPGGGVTAPFKIALQQGGALPELTPSGGGVPFGASAPPPDKFAGVRVKPLLSPEEQAAQSAQSLASNQSSARELSNVQAMSPAKREAYFSAHEHPAQSVAKELFKVGASGAGGGSDAAAASGSPPEIDPIVKAAMLAAGRTGGGGGIRPGAVNPKLQADIARSQEAQDQGQSDVLEDQAAHKLTYLTQEQSLQEQAAAAADADIQRRQAIDHEIQSTKLKSEQAQDALMLAKPKTVDKYWADQGAAAQFGTLIAVMLGGFDSGSRGGPNTAMQQLNTQIDRWVNDQKQQFDVAKDKAELANNRYKDLLNEYGSPEQAAVQLRLQALAAKDSLVKNQAEQMGTPDALAAGQLALQDSILQRKKLQLQAEQIAAAKAAQGGGVKNAALAALEAGARATEAVDKINHFDPKAAAKDAERSAKVRLPDGGEAYVEGPRLKDVQAELVARKRIIDNVEKLIQLDEGGVSAPFTHDKATYNAIRSATLADATVAAGQGAMSKGDEENVSNGIPEAGVTMADRKAALRATLDYQKRALEAAVESNTFKDPSLSRRVADPARAPSSFQRLK